MWLLTPPIASLLTTGIAINPKAKGWASLQDFAHYAGLDSTYISGLEPARRNPILDVIIRLARGLEVSPAELLATFDKSGANRKARTRVMHPVSERALLAANMGHP